MPAQEFGCTIELTLTKAFKTKEDAESFGETLKAYLQEEASKIKGLKITIDSEVYFDIRVTAGTSRVRLGIGKRNIRITIDGIENKESTTVIDQLLNKIISYIYASGPSIKSIQTAYSREYAISGNPLTQVLNPTYVADFSTANKRTFEPAGAVLVSKGENITLLVMIVSGENDKSSGVNIIITSKPSDKPSYDPLAWGNNTLNSNLGNIITSLGGKKIEEKTR